jgi:hypothetical protein
MKSINPCTNINRPTFLERGLRGESKGAYMPGWNGWYHCMSSTYGAWLPGDPRGFRTRNHSEHVEGDYKKPPPAGVYEGRHEAAKNRMKRAAVVLSSEAQRVVVDEVQDSLARHGAEVIAISVSATHMHVLARFPLEGKPTFDERGLRGERTSAVDDPVRHLMGLAKQWSSKRLIEDGLAASGGVWAKRGKIVPIRDRGHQVNVYRYVLEHARKEHAAVWSFRGTDNLWK